MALRILGIDPGLNITGYGVIEIAPKGPRLSEAGVVDRKSTRLNSSHIQKSRMPSSA